MPLSYDVKNYADLGGCYPPSPLLDLHNFFHHTVESTNAPDLPWLQRSVLKLVDAA